MGDTKRQEYDNRETRIRRYHMAWELAQDQAEDEALWCLCDGVEIAYMQQELRRLHEVIEGEREYCRKVGGAQ